jgi:RNA-binding protein
MDRSWLLHVNCAAKVPDFRLRTGGKQSMLTPGMKRKIRHELSAEKPTVWIGKEGATGRALAEINRQLDSKEMIKVRIQKTVVKEEKAKTLASQISQQTSAALVEVRGHTFMLYRRRKHKHV